MWFKVDDKLHDHRKARKAGKAAMGVWVLAGSWCGNNLTDGFVPREILSRWGTPKDAQALVAAGLWEQAEQDGEKGWRFHNWTDFQPSKADEEAKSRLKSEAGRKGGLNSASNRKRVSAQARASADGQAGASSRIQARPDPTRPDLKTSSSPTADAAPDQAIRDDVERLCDRLAARVEANTGKRPTITKTWRESARLLIDRDGRTEPQVACIIDWSQSDEFWRGNILSMPKLREKFDQLVLKSSVRPQLRVAPNGHQGPVNGYGEPIFIGLAPDDKR
jgi:hypothetical protein